VLRSTGKPIAPIGAEIRESHWGSDVVGHGTRDGNGDIPTEDLPRLPDDLNQELDFGVYVGGTGHVFSDEVAQGLAKAAVQAVKGHLQSIG
jgi:hypothetical protein